MAEIALLSTTSCTRKEMLNPIIMELEEDYKAMELNARIQV